MTDEQQRGETREESPKFIKNQERSHADRLKRPRSRSKQEFHDLKEEMRYYAKKGIDEALNEIIEENTGYNINNGNINVGNSISIKDSKIDVDTVREINSRENPESGTTEVEMEPLRTKEKIESLTEITKELKDDPKAWIFLLLILVILVIILIITI